MASLVDTNILVYRFDARDPVKQQRAREVLRNGLLDDSLVLAHQCIVEFIAAVTRPREALARAPLLPLSEATLEAEKLLTQYPVLYPAREVVLTALRGMGMYGLSWFDAHLWAHAEVYGVDVSHAWVVKRTDVLTYEIRRGRTGPLVCSGIGRSLMEAVGQLHYPTRRPLIQLV